MSQTHSPANWGIAFALLTVTAVFTGAALAVGHERGNEAHRQKARAERLCAFHWSHARTPYDTLSTLRECPLPEKK